MTTGVRPWPVRLTATAESDFRNILRWTTEQFGEARARVYAETLSAALGELSAGPKLIGVKTRNDIAKGLFTLHVARHGRKGRHFVMFRIGHRQEQEVGLPRFRGRLGTWVSSGLWQHPPLVVNG